MALTKQFSKKLDQLWKRRIADFRSLVVPSWGAILKFTRSRRDAMINDILEIASRIVLKREGHREFDRVVVGRRLRMIKGRGLLERGDNLVGWAREKLRGPIVYAFWRRRKCLYVGKGESWRRLTSYRKSAYMIEATCLEVFLVSGKSNLAKVECLATHMFNPRDIKAMPAEVRWGKTCPVCEKHDRIRSELRAIFKMR
jgi:hypothetical protein